MKNCNRCLKEKKIEEMSVRKPDFCKWCLVQINMKKYDLSEKGKEKAKRFSQSEKGKLKVLRANVKKTESGYKKKWRATPQVREKELEYNRVYLKNNPEKRKLYSKARRERYPGKDAARRKLKYELRMGRVLKPDICSECNFRSKIIDAHHTDYDRPLDVIWLCRPCHAKKHKKEG
jgi:hypothetical protein